MKTLREHTIIYDDECPMCNLYTGTFIKTGMLDENGRVAFSRMPVDIRNQVDHQRACNEIALINHKRGKVLYGIDSLFAVLGNRYHLLRPLFSSRIFRWLAEKLYSFISFNRKVIAPGKVFEAVNSCTPDYNISWRLAYIFFAWIVTSIVLTKYATLLTNFLPAGNFGREFLICGGQIVFQSFTVFFLKPERLLHYIGNMMTISLAGSFLLTPALIVAHYGLIHHELFYLFWFMGVVGLMFIEHLRRVAYLDIHWSASLSWIVYRFMVLIILLWLL
ncbi:MAG TPA: DCC1-like thiol-disulfide oxidoreductase family protein [Ohtaekwangia sp.]